MPVKTKAEIEKAWAQWREAPMHIKLMAGPYMTPILHALSAIDMELEALRARLPE